EGLLKLAVWRWNQQPKLDLALRVLTGGFADAGNAAREFDMKMRQMTGIAKAKHSAAFVRMLVESGQPVILYGWHHEVYEIWEQELRDLNPVFYTGKQSPARAQPKRRLQRQHSSMVKRSC
ncbi:MAG: hypothetical protein IBX50_18050, partial [Marinospirillum sp.]|uniref:hypothetical protein n=1 Tax=Marinospirillum sp. TaxID=2183934 RepID=UPI001A04B5C3